MPKNPLAPELAEKLVSLFETSSFNRLLGMKVVEVGESYARTRLPHAPEIHQTAGFIHGGAIATLIDSTAGLAVFTTLSQRPKVLATVDMHVHYLEGVRGEDMVAEARIRRRGRSIVFVAVEVHSDAGRQVAHGELSFRLILE